MPRAHLHLRTLKRMLGVVVSTAMDRTAVVAIPRLRMHAKTQKIARQTTAFFCHDEHEVCGVGDRVEITPCAQLSKKKHWAVVDILARQPQLAGEPFPFSRLRTPPAAALAAGAARAAAAAPPPATATAATATSSSSADAPSDRTPAGSRAALR